MTGTGSRPDNQGSMERNSPKDLFSRLARRPLQALGFLALAPLAAAVALGLITGCVSSGSEVLDASELRVFEARTFAWVEESVTAPEVEGAAVVRERSDELIAQARQTLTAQLLEKGYRLTSEDGAAVHLALRLDVSEEQRQNDPYFTVDQFERFERGHLTLMAFVPVTYVPVWRAKAAVKLRDTARGMGPGEIRWETLEETRDWRLEKLSSTLVGRMP